MVQVEFSAIRAAGVIVQEVPHLCTDASYIAEINLVVVKAGLDHSTRQWCAEYLLPDVLAHSPSPADS